MKKKGVKIVTIGGGSSYTPELIDGFIKRIKELPVREIWLVDIEDGKEKLEIVGKLARRMIKAAGIDCKIHLTLDRRKAIKGADFVTTQFRVGLLDARIKDEKIPFENGLLGQETNGAGGMFKAFRTIPVILDIVKDIKELAPDAWLINFTNPAGMVTEAVLKYGKFDKVVGLCNVPVNLMMDCAKIYEKKVEDFFFQFAGLNHFVWYNVYDKKGNDITYDLMEKLQDEENIGVKNIVNFNFDYTQIKNLGMLPCPYHRYYYLQDEMLKQSLKDYKEKGTRGEIVKKVEEELFELYKNADLHEKPKQLEQRGGAYYSDAACEIINGIYNNKGTVMAVNTKNKGAIEDLPYDSAVEISSYITSSGPKPLNFGKFPNAGQRGYIQIMKAMEELTVEAAVTGDYGTALQAFTTNPLVPGTEIARKVLNELLDAHEKYLPQFKEYYENREKYRVDLPKDKKDKIKTDKKLKK
ncbi:6-phospho-beta-glucosidase [Leptotrichia sp. OH3620_COT-345]|uniref:6-phospho-beta-glucosidase n=1 Tax=Leptotrichia sp. OH3620_COT-345 TaxID=2491048 RepID=UPI000F6549CB|nr:6-phospho-beta-glucosidase [Leptotrichia sp. OH3620_COT-345]RRD39381.1 6-phospho-beta-glucosidase [Leptotrichia sp. OH3620_COT-345]